MQLAHIVGKVKCAEMMTSEFHKSRNCQRGDRFFLHRDNPWSGDNVRAEQGFHRRRKAVAKFLKQFP